MNLATYKFTPWRSHGDLRIVAAESAWRKVEKWANQVNATEIPGMKHERPRVLVGVDVFEDWSGAMVNSNGSRLYDAESGEVLLTMQDVRSRLFRLIDATPNLDWLVLTEHPENIGRMMPAYFPGGYIAEAGKMNQEGPRPNLWLGVTVHNQSEADERIPHLLKVPAAVRYVRCVVTEEIELVERFNDGGYRNYLTGQFYEMQCKGVNGNPDFTVNTEDNRLPKISWLILTGETGPRARPCRVEWIRSLVGQCREAGVACWVENIGSKPLLSEQDSADCEAVEFIRHEDGPQWSRYGRMAGRFESAANTIETLTGETMYASNWIERNTYYKRLPDRDGVEVFTNYNRPLIVCLCGSTRFMEAWQAANLSETLAGNIVLSIGCNTKSDADLQRMGQLTEETKIQLDELHKRKIDLADEILVLNVGGYIGESTRSEIEHAIKGGKTIRYLEPEKVRQLPEGRK